MTDEIQRARRTTTRAPRTKLAAIRARHDAIIPGPWRWYGNTATDQVYLATVNRGRLFVMSPGVHTTEYVYHYGFEEGCDKYLGVEHQGPRVVRRP